jgi:hypothetical protein
MELTNEQKLRVLIAHRDYIRADAARQSALTTLTQVVDLVGKELGVEKDKYDLNIETFELTEKKA